MLQMLKMLQKITSMQLNQPRIGERGQLSQLKRYSSERSAWQRFSSQRQYADGVGYQKIYGQPAVWGGPKRPQLAAGAVRSALSAVEFSTGFSKPARSLTKHISTEYPGPP